MAFQTGTQIRPELGRADVSGFARGGAAIGAGILQGIENYQQQKQITSSALADLEGRMAADPDLLQTTSQAGGDIGKAFKSVFEEGNYKQGDVLKLSGFVNSLEATKSAQRAAELQQAAMELERRKFELQEKQFLATSTEPQDSVVTKEQLDNLSKNFSVTTQPRQDGTFQITSMTSKTPTTPKEIKGKVITKEEFDERTEAGQRPKVEFDAEGNMRLLSVEPVGGTDEEPLTPFQLKTSESLAKEFSTWMTGGKQQAEGNLKAYKTQIAGLRSGEINTRTFLDFLPSALGIQESTRALFKPLDQQGVDRMNQIIFQGLRETLGAQFTQREAERLVAASYNPKLPEALNIERVQASADILENVIRAKNNLMAHMNAGGNIGNYKGPIAEDILESSIRDLELNKQGVPLLTPSGASVTISKRPR